MKHALVLGGTGTIGREVVRGLAAADIATTFTYFQNDKLAQTLENECQCKGISIDLRDHKAVENIVRTIARQHSPNIFIHCATVMVETTLTETPIEIWDAAMAVNCRSAFIACRELAPLMAQNGGGDIVLLGALDRTQSFQIPVCFAATQGALSTMAMALAKELGPTGIRINQITFGFLEAGISQKISAKLHEDYKYYSALKRFGTPHEAAQAILWLALHNQYINGKVIPVNGGI